MNLYQIGRSLQLLGLLLMPSAIWLAHFRRDEAGSITIFAGSFLIFYLGLWIARKGK